MTSKLSSDELMMKLGRAIDLLVQLKVHEIRGDKSQKEMILLLDSFGCSPSEIANLLKTTTTTVSPILSRGRNPKNKQ